jgi:hypothetical protein
VRVQAAACRPARGELAVLADAHVAGGGEAGGGDLLARASAPPAQRSAGSSAAQPGGGLLPRRWQLRSEGNVDARLLVGLCMDLFGGALVVAVVHGEGEGVAEGDGAELLAEAFEGCAGGVGRLLVAHPESAEEESDHHALETGVPGEDKAGDGAALGLSSLSSRGDEN